MLIIVLYTFWKVFSATHKDPRINHRGWRLYIKTSETDVMSGIRDGVLKTPQEVEEVWAKKRNRTAKEKILAVPMGLWTAIFEP